MVVLTLEMTNSLSTTQADVPLNILLKLRTKIMKEHTTGENYTKKEVNTILEVLKDFDITDNGIIDQEIIDFEISNYNSNNLERLKGYKVSVTKHGFHSTDSQLVEYTFTFISPEKVKSSFLTEKCLMVGWNHCNDVTIK
jgi:hypothetical protein